MQPMPQFIKLCRLPSLCRKQLRILQQPFRLQLIWEFQTKGVSNARATEYLKTRVQEQFASSGLFAKVSDAPVPGGALLTATVNNAAGVATTSTATLNIQ